MPNPNEDLRMGDLPNTPTIVIRIQREWRPGLSEQQLYERVRRYWRAKPERRPKPPVLAVGIADSIICGIYWIEGWESYEMGTHRKDADRLDQSPHPPGERVGFVGRSAAEFSNLIGRRITDAPKGQNPISYLHTEA